MTTFARLLFSVLLVFVISLASHVWVGKEAEHSVLRLSWSLVGEMTTVKLTEEELLARPVHMRPGDGVLESQPVPYHLRLVIDGEVVQDRVVKPAGLRGDRPMYVYQELPIDSGEHVVKLTYGPEERDLPGLTYRLNQTLSFRPGEIVTLGLQKDDPKFIIRQVN